MVLGPCGSHLGPKSPKSEKNMVRGYALGGPFARVILVGFWTFLWVGVFPERFLMPKELQKGANINFF